MRRLIRRLKGIQLCKSVRLKLIVASTKGMDPVSTPNLVLASSKSCMDLFEYRASNPEATNKVDMGFIAL